MQPVQVVVGDAVVPWPGAGRCRRTFADIDEPAKNVSGSSSVSRAYASFPTTRTETQREHPS